MVTTREMSAALKEEYKKTEITTEKMFNTVNSWLEELPELEEAFECLDYSIANRFSTKMQEAAAEGKEFWKAEAVVNTGGSEGVYIDCRLLLYPDGVIDVGTYKTLDAGIDAYIKMGMIAGAFTKAAEEYLYVNSL